jgi:hypothetical protein
LRQEIKSAVKPGRNGVIRLWTAKSIDWRMPGVTVQLSASLGWTSK